jgi:FkbM family methyltransferase
LVGGATEATTFPYLTRHGSCKEALMLEDLVFDIGMNNGDDTAYYLHEGFRVVAVEAHPQLVEQTRLRFQREIEEGRLVILNVGIAEQPGEMPFWVCETQSDWSSFDRRVASRDGCLHHELMVQCRTFASVIDEHGVPFYSKIDIEGNDLLCVKDLKPATLPKYVSVEASGTEGLAVLADRGYTRFKCISQFDLLPVQLPPSAEHRRVEFARRMLSSNAFLARVFRRLVGRERLQRMETQSRRVGDWMFPPGSSGPFGKKLPGRWQTYAEMERTYETFQQMMRRGEPSLFWNEKGYSFWADFHAMRDG